MVDIRVYLILPSGECLNLNLHRHEHLKNDVDLLTLLSEILIYSCLQFFIAQNSVKMFCVILHLIAIYPLVCERGIIMMCEVAVS